MCLLIIYHHLYLHLVLQTAWSELMTCDVRNDFLQAGFVFVPSNRCCQKVMTKQQMTGVHDVMSSTFLSSGTAAVKHCQKFQVTICGGDWAGTSTLKNRKKCQFLNKHSFCKLELPKNL